MDLIDHVLHPDNGQGWQDLQESTAGSEELLYNAEAYGYYLAKRNRSTNVDVRMDKSARERFGMHVQLQFTLLVLFCVAVQAQHFYVGDSYTNVTFRLSDTIGGDDNTTQIMIPGEYLESRAIGDKGIYTVQGPIMISS